MAEGWKEKVQIVTTSRVNEAKRWGQDVLNIERVLYTYSKLILGKGENIPAAQIPDMIIEVIENPGKQKGGTFG